MVDSLVLKNGWVVALLIVALVIAAVILFIGLFRDAIEDDRLLVDAKHKDPDAYPPITLRKALTFTALSAIAAVPVCLLVEPDLGPWGAVALTAILPAGAGFVLIREALRGRNK